MPCSIPPSQLTAFVAAMLGRLEGKIMARVQIEVNKIQQALLGSVCPPVEELKKFLKVRDNLLNAINKVEQKVEPIKKFAEILDPPIKAAKATVIVLEQIPIETTIGTPPTGGPSDIGGKLFSISIGAQNRFAQLLKLACELVELLDRDQKGILDLTTLSVTGTLQPIREKLNSVDVKLFECVDELPDDIKDEILAEINNLPSNAGLTEEIAPNKFSYSQNGNDYTIRIIEETDSPSYAKKRYAVVENIDGVAVLKGPSSFSSSTRVLIDEIKFRINNQLP